jgi:hypothetical protein
MVYIYRLEAENWRESWLLVMGPSFRQEGRQEREREREREMTLITTQQLTINNTTINHIYWKRVYVVE